MPRRNPKRLPPSLREVRSAIPRALFVPDNRLAAGFLGRVLGLLILCFFASYFAMQQGWWWLYPLNWMATGTVLFGLFEVAHNCGHHAYFSSRRLNALVGHLATIPLLYPFTQWKLWHDAHHRRPNVTEQTLYEQFRGRMTLGLDTAFSPLRIEKAQHARKTHMLAWLAYRASRAVTPVAVFMAPLLLSVFFARDLRPQDREACRRSLWFSLLSVPACMGGLVWMTGSYFSLLHFWILPLGVYAFWLGYYALLQHTGESIPVFDEDQWTSKAQFLAVVNTRTPRLISWIHGGGEFHCVHHIAPNLPNYRLAAAFEALRASEHSDWIRDVPFSIPFFFKVQRDCQVWDPKTRAYRSIAFLDADSP